MVVSKWVILVLTCFVGFGSYYSFETPSVLHNAMFRHYDIPDKAQFELYFSLIYSLYALPNMIIPMIGGAMADKFGNKMILLVFSSFILIGSAIETFACFQKSMVMFLFGRFVFGCGAETLNVCVSIIISKWFKGQELALALAIILSLSKLATVVTDWISPLMYHQIGIEGNAVCVTTLCLVCFLLTIVLTRLDTDESDHSHLLVKSRHNSRADLSRLIGSNRSSFSNMVVYEDIEIGLEMHSGSASSGSSVLSHRGRGNSIPITLDRSLSPTHSIQSLHMDASDGGDYSLGHDHGNDHSHSQLIQRKKADEASSSGPTETDSLLLHSQVVICQTLNDDHLRHKDTVLPQFWGFSLPMWLVLLFTLVMYGTFIPFTNWSTVILLQFYFTKKNPTAAYVAWSEIMAARYKCLCC